MRSEDKIREDFAKMRRNLVSEFGHEGVDYLLQVSIENQRQSLILEAIDTLISSYKGKELALLAAAAKAHGSDGPCLETRQ